MPAPSPRPPKWAGRPIDTASARSRGYEGVPQPHQILLWCVTLILLEVNHLKWIWWTYWECAKCGHKHKDALRRKWIMFL